MKQEATFSPGEQRTLRSLSTPAKVQRYLDRLPYNTEPNGDTLRSPRRVMRDKTAHCAEGAFFAAAALRFHGRPALVMDLEAERDTDHVIALYREGVLWGAVSQSRFAGLRFRSPIYRSLRELALSFFEDYFNWAGERSLRTYSRPVALAKFDRLGWMTDEDDLWPVAEHLTRIPHTRLFPTAAARRLVRVDRRTFDANLHGAPPR